MGTVKLGTYKGRQEFVIIGHGVSAVWGPFVCATLYVKKRGGLFGSDTVEDRQRHYPYSGMDKHARRMIREVCAKIKDGRWLRNRRAPVHVCRELGWC